MTYLSSIEELKKYLKTELTTLSQISSDNIRDVDSEYGVDLDVNPEDSIFDSATPSNLLLLFELKPYDSAKDVSERNVSSLTNTIDYSKMFKMKIIIYGDSSMDKAMQIIARLRSEEARDDLMSKGIHIEEVSEMEEVAEFLNGVYWMRNDFEITLGATFSIPLIKTPYEYQGYSQTKIYTK